MNIAPQVTATNVLGRLAQATSPTETVTFSYDDLGQVNARLFTDNRDTLGRLSSSVHPGRDEVFDQRFQYDPLGNLTELTDAAGRSGPSGPSRVALSYLSTDRDEICRITYGTGTATTCDVVHDLLGNITEQPTRTRVRELSYFADGSSVRDVDFTNPTFPYGTPRPGHPGPPLQHGFEVNDPRVGPRSGYRRGGPGPLP